MQIRQVTIDRFRGLRYLQFDPGPRTLILGPNNAGKSSVLDALDLLFQPGVGRPRLSPTEVDYFNRDPSGGFSIEAVVGDLTPQFRAEVRQHLEGWRAQQRALCPETDGEGTEAIVRVRVRATPDFDLVHEFAKPESEGTRFAPSHRAHLGWVYDGRTRDPLRELAFYQGGLLDRLFAKVELTPAISSLRAALDSGALSVNLDTSIVSVLSGLADDLRGQGLLRQPEAPEFEAGSVSRRELLQTLRLALTIDGVRIPLQRQGRGAQRLLLLAVLLRLARSGSGPIIGGFEEPEEALEPLRQGQIARMLLEVTDKGGQIFVVTHSTEIARQFAIDDFLLLSERGHGEDARQLRTVVTAANRQAYERRVDGPVTRGLFANIPLLVEGPSDRGVLETFWNCLANQKRLPLQSEIGVDIINCEGCSHMPAMAALLAQAGKSVVIWAEQDNDQVVKEVARIEAAGTYGVLVKATGAVGPRNLEGALTAKCSIRAIVMAMNAIAADRGYGWAEQRNDLVNRWTGTSEKRERMKAAMSLGELMAALDPSEARQLSARALAANKPTPFELKGARQGRIFAEALIAAEGVPTNFESALQELSEALKTANPAKATVSLESDPTDNAASARPGS